MPELPEVETIRGKLEILVVGKEIQKVEILKEKSFQGDVSLVEGQTIVAVKRRAKILQFVLSNNQYILVHLKMTGQLIYVDDEIKMGGGHPTADWINDLPSKHTRVILNFTDESRLFFNDMRIFGWLKVVGEKSVKSEFRNYGPDINDSELEVSYLQQKLSNRRIPIKQAMMMNSIVAGLGNIYMCDALNLAKINPLRPSSSLSTDELETLLHASRTVIDRGIKSGGATIDDYRDVDGFSGNYQNQILVYGREGDACRNCGAVIVKIKLGGRGTYFCESCQV